MQGYVPRLARREDFGRIFEGVGSSSAESVHARDWCKRHQGRRGAYMATPADRMHTAPGLGARSSNQQRGRGVYASCLFPTMQYFFLKHRLRLRVRATRNSIFIQQSRLALPSPRALPFLIA